MSDNDDKGLENWLVVQDDDGSLLLQSPKGEWRRVDTNRHEMEQLIRINGRLAEKATIDLHSERQRIKTLEAAITRAIGYYVEWCDSDVDDGFDDCPDFVSEMVAELREVNE